MQYNNFDYWQKNVAALGFPVQTKEDIDRVLITLYRREKSLNRVGRLLGVSGFAVRNHLLSLGEPLRPSGGANNLFGYGGKSCKRKK